MPARFKSARCSLAHAEIRRPRFQSIVEDAQLEADDLEVEAVLAALDGAVAIEELRPDEDVRGEADLEAVKGIGAATAKKIIANRPYKSLDELATKAGIPETNVKKLKRELTVGSALTAPSSAAAPAQKPTPVAEKNSVPPVTPG